MTTKALKTGKFNLFNENRTHTKGNARKYILENAAKVINDPATQESIVKREKLGFFGHGRRQMAGKVRLREVEPVRLPNGQTILVENVPCSATTALTIDGAGNITHEQEILETAPGKVVTGLIESRVGGWSWACDGLDGGRVGLTRIKSYEGMDYVYMPSFSDNRSYILEDVSPQDRRMLLENITGTGIAESEAEKYLNYWMASAQMRVVELEEDIRSREIFEATINETVREQEAALQVVRTAGKKRRQLVTEAAQSSGIAFPDDVTESLIHLETDDDIRRVVAFFEAAAKADTSFLPIPGSFKETPAPPSNRRRMSEIGYGDPLAGYTPDRDSLSRFRKWGQQ